MYHFLCIVPIHYGPNHKGNICVFKACAITTHSSDACLRKQKLCSYRKASGCGGGLDMQDQQRRVWELMRRRGVSVQTTEKVRGVWGQQQWPERGGAGVLMVAHKRVSDHTSDVCLSGPMKVEPRHVSLVCIIWNWFKSGRTDLSSKPE